MQQLFAESALMGALGGVCGAALTLLGIQVFRVLAGDFPNIDSVGIDGRVLLFTLAVSLLTAILVGCTPALQASNPDLNLTLREGDRRTGTGSRRRTRHILAVSEIALAMVLLVGAGLMVHSISRLRLSDSRCYVGLHCQPNGSFRKDLLHPGPTASAR